MMLRIIILLASTLAVSPVLGQTAIIEGRITTATGEALPGVHVTIDGRGAVSNPEGRFLVTAVPFGEHVLRVTAVGFETLSRSIVVTQERIVLELVLEEAVVTGAEVVVTASRREQALLLSPSSVSVLTAAELETRHTRSMDDILRLLPGVQLADNQVSIRGSSGFSYNTGSRILLLVDGMPLLGPESDGVPFDALPLSQIERIEVLKGPGSALYGSGALGGVVQVLTRDFPDEPQTSLRLSAGAHGRYRHELWRLSWPGASSPTPFGSANLTHARSLGERAGGWITLHADADAGHLQHSSRRMIQGFGKFGWRPSDRIRIQVLAGHTYRQRDIFLYWNGLRDPLSPGNLSLGGHEALGKSHDRSGQWVILPEVAFVEGKAFFHHVRGRFYRATFRPVTPEGEPKGIEDATIGYRYGAEWQGIWAAAPTTHVTFGVTGDMLSASSSFFRDDFGRTVVHGQPEASIFAQIDHTIADRLTVVPGLRFDGYVRNEEQTDTRFSPKLAVSYLIRPDAALRASAGSGFRVPGLAERFSDNRDFFPIVSNPNLAPENSVGLEIGYRSTTTVRTATIDIDVAAFTTWYEGLIEPRFLTEVAAFRFVNLTEARIAGVEAGATLRTGPLRSSMNYTFLDARDLTEGEALHFRSRHLLQSGLDVALPAGFRVGSDFRLASRPVRVDSDFARFVRDAQTMVPVRHLDARASFARAFLTIDVIVQNVLDYYYVERPAILAPPRSILLRVRIE
jgi:outer membrane receptor for ferrienterochelin and colicins